MLVAELARKTRQSQQKEKDDFLATGELALSSTGFQINLKSAGARSCLIENRTSDEIIMHSDIYLFIFVYLFFERTIRPKVGGLAPLDNASSLQTRYQVV